MNKTGFLIGFFCTTFFAFAQQTPLETDTLQVTDSLKITRVSQNLDGKTPFKMVLKDSVAFNLKKYARAKRIDSLWLYEILNSDLYSKMSSAVANAPYKKEVYKKLPTKTLKKRLAKIDAKTPLKIEYSSSLESVIHYYLKRDKKTMEKLMELSAYYFPMFEEHLAKYDIPLEIKYLAVVESALDPRAKSWVGATGLWQFMFATGKMHGLGVSSYVDERMDPIMATEAACQYLSTLYEMFGDWNLALASYNAGPGNVSRAIRRSGGNTDYWEIRKYLPRETAGYVPAFFATMYLFEYADEHGFQPKTPQITYFETDTIHVKELLTFEHISKITGINKKLLSFLNPSYKLDIIPHIKDKNYYLRLPLLEAGLFVANEDAIYGYVKEEIAENKKELPRYYEAQDKVRYRVRPGDYLGKIADRYGVSVSNIKRWNGLRSSRISIGQRLTIYPKKPAAMLSVTTEKSPSEKEQIFYTVKKGDSLWSISRKFPGLTVQEIQKWNDISGTSLKPGMKLKLSKS